MAFEADTFSETSNPHSINKPRLPAPFAVHKGTNKLEDTNGQVENAFISQDDAQTISSREEAPLARTNHPTTATTGMETANHNCTDNLAVLPEPDRSEMAPGPCSTIPTENHQALMEEARSFFVRYAQSGVVEDINKAINCWNRAIEVIPDGHIDKARSLSNLGCSYIRRHEHLGNIADLNEAIDCGVHAVHLSPDDYEQKPAIISSLGTHYLSRYELSGYPSDIETALKYQVQAVSLAPDDYAGKPGCLAQLGATYHRRFERLGELSDINNAIDFQTQATVLGNEFGDHPNRAAWFANLGNAYLTRFETLGGRLDVNRAIEFHSMAVKLTPDSSVDKARRLDNLGNSYHSRFLYLGELSDVNSAIEFNSQAVTITADGHPDKPAYLNNLGNGYSSRFEIVGELSDLDQAICCFDKAVRLTPDNHMDKPTWLSGLAMAHELRFLRRRETSDIKEVVNHLARAHSLLPSDDARRPQILMHMGNGYRHLFDFLGELPDIDKAIDYHSQAASLVPDSYAIKSGMLNNLGKCYSVRFTRLGQYSDLDESIKFLTQAVNLVPPGHVDTLLISFNLGSAYLQRYYRMSNIQDGETAIEYLHKAAMCSVGIPYLRFRASHELAILLALIKSPHGETGYQHVIEQLPRLVWLGTTIEQRYNIVAKMGSFARDAVAMAINEFGNYDRALEWLDTSRSIVWSQILQLRTPFDQLRAENPSLAETLSLVSRGLERAGTRSSSAPLLANRLDLEKEARNHLDLAAQWEQSLQLARKIPGFEGFMLPHNSSELKRAAKDGPIVVINIFATTCDGLIIRPDKEEIGRLSLSGFSQNKAMEFQGQLGSLVGRQGTGADTRHLGRLRSGSSNSFAHMLATLWSSVAKPVLDFLGYTDKQPNGVLPHITWCTTGALSFLPIHAAGCYDPGSEIGVSDFAVSSYTPNISALLSHDSQDAGPHLGILAISQESTSGLNPLPGTRLELAAIKETAKGVQHFQLEDEKATVDAVLQAMEKYSWVHLACHATQHPDDPAKSAFHLHDGNLTLSEISKQAFKGKGLAFLSACQTATGSKLLPDEAVHLAAGMLMAGYPSVIATMWAIQDEDAPEIARDVYADLLKDGNMDYRGAARALHKAVARLRKEVGVISFERWVPFIHFGQ